jgi:hypothetical protein
MLGTDSERFDKLLLVTVRRILDKTNVYSACHTSDFAAAYTMNRITSQ